MAGGGIQAADQTAPNLPPVSQPALTSIQAFLTNAASLGESARVRLRGVVTHSTSDKTFFIQDAGAGTYVFHRPEKSLVPCDVVEVIANPSLGGAVPTLQNCTVTVAGKASLPVPVVLTTSQASDPANAMKLARMTGRLQKHRLAAGRTLVLQPGTPDPVFEVDAEALTDLGLLDQFPAGCLLEATGVVVPKRGPNLKIASIRLLIRSPADLVVLKGPPFWSGGRLAEAAVATAGALAIALAWVAMLRREVRRQTAIIAQRFEKEAALRASEDRFLKVFRTTPDVLVIARAADERILDVNPAFERVTGFPRAEAVGRTSLELGLSANPRLRGELLGRFKEGVPVANISIEARRKSGEPIWLQASLEWIEWNGEKCWLSVARDITEQKQAEEQRRQLELMLHQSQKLEALGTMAGGIAHDVNNILAAILGNAEFGRMAGGALSADLQACLDGIQSAALRGKNLVSQIQAFSRKQRLNKQAIHLDSTLTEGSRLLRAIAPASIRIETRIHPGCPPVLADGDAILQVIVNLGTNGCHAMERRPGALVLEIEPFTVDPSLAKKHPELAAGSACLRLSVSDEGEGMDAQTMQRIFDPFFTTKAPGKGTGLGLAIAHSTVANHQGAIEVESVPGAGSRFLVYLPAAGPSAPAKEPRAQPAAPRRGGGESILLVDDEPAVAGAMKRILERIGYQVTALNLPGEALKLLQAEPDRFQLLLSDLNMPVMNGLELISRVRSFRPTLPVILLSGYITDEHRSRADADPALQFLQKPATTEELAQGIREGLQKGGDGMRFRSAKNGMAPV